MVVSLFELGAEKVRRQLAVVAVIMQALATFMLALTRLIGAIAHLYIIFDKAIHSLPPDWNVFHFNHKRLNLALPKYQVGLCTRLAGPGSEPTVWRSSVGRNLADPANPFFYLNFMTVLFFVLADGRVSPHCLPVFCPMSLRTGMCCLDGRVYSPSFLGAASP